MALGPASQDAFNKCVYCSFAGFKVYSIYYQLFGYFTFIIQKDFFSGPGREVTLRPIIKFDEKQVD
jgi:hypothetical protein